VNRATRFRLEAAVVAAASAIVSRLPRRLMLALGGSLGEAVGRLDRRHLAIAVENLRQAFPDWDAARVRGTALRVYRHFGRVLLDLIWLQGRSREEVLSLVDFVGIEHIEAALAQGRGYIGPSCHIGNWEIHGLAHGFAYDKLALVGRPLDNPWLDARLVRLRTASGNLVISKHHALGGILRALRGGRGVAIVMDQNVQASDGVFVRFFGRPAATTTVVAALAAKTGCAIVPGRCVFVPGDRYLVRYEAPIRWEPGGDRDGGIAALTQALTSQIEAWVREDPEQWLWIHRRWKTQPEDAPKAPPAPKPVDTP
jgi:KDO2-lipid IV(A) lauroyltransferase